MHSLLCSLHLLTLRPLPPLIAVWVSGDLSTKVPGLVLDLPRTTQPTFAAQQPLELRLTRVSLRNTGKMLLPTRLEDRLRPNQLLKGSS
jgi:hypothetical protein